MIILQKSHGRAIPFESLDPQEITLAFRFRNS